MKADITMKKKDWTKFEDLLFKATFQKNHCKVFIPVLGFT